MSMKNPQQISTNGHENAWAYFLPTYKVTDEGIVDAPETEIKFCKGDKADSSKERQDGVFVESLLAVVIDRLKRVNVGDLSTRETSLAITNLEQGLMWLVKRTEDRKARGVEQTYQK